MNPLDLYHGGEAPVKDPQVVSPKAVRPLDFGSGFYTTTSQDQAKKWIGIRLRQHAYDIARLKTYKLVDQVLFHTEAALEFLRFVDSEVVA